MTPRPRVSHFSDWASHVPWNPKMFSCGPLPSRIYPILHVHSWSWTQNVGLFLFFQLKVKSNQNHFEFDAVSDYINNPSWLQVTGKRDTHIFSVLLPVFGNDVGSIGTKTEALTVTTHVHVDPELFINLMGNQPQAENALQHTALLLSPSYAQSSHGWHF